MAYSDPFLPPDGFEGIIVSSKESDSINESTSFEGVVVHSESNLIPKYPSGFNGVLVAYSDVERFFKITDYRGNPLKNVTVTAQNTGGDVSAITGSNGIVALEIDVSGTITIVLEKEKTFKNLSYEYASEPTLKEIVLQPTLL